MKKYHILTTLFPVILFLGFLGSILVKDRAHSDLENRYLAQLPSFTVKSLSNGSYMESLDHYWNDQFPARDTWITGKTLAEKSIFQKTVINDVYLASDHYLINRYTDKDVDTHQITQNCNYLHRFQEKYHANVVLIPSASEILTDKLPVPSDQLDFTAILSSVATTTFADTILSSHKTEPIYYKTDHHWTLQGAYAVYTHLVQKPVPYAPITVSTDFQGTVGRKIGISKTLDTIQQQQSTSEFRVLYDGNPDTLTDTLYVPHYLESSDQYSYFLDGNHGITQIDNLSMDLSEDSSLSTSDSPSLDGDSILIVKDSFANTLATLLCENYKTVYMIDLRQYNGSIETFVKEKGIKDVLFLYSKINFMQDKNLSKLLR